MAVMAEVSTSIISVTRRFLSIMALASERAVL